MVFLEAPEKSQGLYSKSPRSPPSTDWISGMIDKSMLILSFVAVRKAFMGTGPITCKAKRELEASSRHLSLIILYCRGQKVQRARTCTPLRKGVVHCARTHQILEVLFEYLEIFRACCSIHGVASSPRPSLSACMNPGPDPVQGVSKLNTPHFVE
jgi:hypothetical protein